MAHAAAPVLKIGPAVLDRTPTCHPPVLFVTPICSSGAGAEKVETMHMEVHPWKARQTTLHIQKEMDCRKAGLVDMLPKFQNGDAGHLLLQVQWSNVEGLCSARASAALTCRARLGSLVRNCTGRVFKRSGGRLNQAQARALEPDGGRLRHARLR